MKLMHIACVALGLAAALAATAQSPAGTTAIEDNYSDTWVATDGLGRAMPTIAEAGPVKTDKQRVVGIFYVTWHGQGSHNDKMPAGAYYHDVDRILKASPKARLDINDKEWRGGGSYHWGEPENGYFLSADPWVVRKDISMLADAGVDVLILDATNAVLYFTEWDVLFKTMRQMKAEGNKVPRFCFWSFNGNSITVVQKLYERYYKTNSYRDLWFYWDGKPLLLCNKEPMVDANFGKLYHDNPNYDPAAATDVTNPHYGDPDYCNKYYTDYTKEVKDFFTMRNMWWGYYKWNGHRYVGTEDNWSYGYGLTDANVRNLPLDSLVARHNGVAEEFAVTPAQHALTMVGKSWSRSAFEPKLDNHDMPAEAYVPWLGKKVKNPVAYGIYFQDRWDEALKCDPSFLYLNDWNEWTAILFAAGKFADGTAGGPTTFMGRNSPLYFVDQYNAEFNRTISPMKGGYTDNYYMQMAQNIRRYKGVRPIPELKGLSNFAIDGKAGKWNDVKVTYYDTKGDVTHRDYDGYGGTHYVNNSGRNDIAHSKVAVTASTVNFYVETTGALSPSTDPNWMLLLIDADGNHDTGWCGYDFIVNKKVNSPSETVVMKWTGKQWKQVATAPMAVGSNFLELALPRTLLGLTGSKFSFDFKWADNPAELKDAISLCTDGDTAPNRRFNYRCIWNK